MKKAIRLFVLFVFTFVGLSHSASAQDVITKKNGKKISVWIKEVSDSQLKYIEVGDPNEIIFTIDRVLVSAVEFSHGGKLKEESGEYTEEYFADDRNQNVKINFVNIRRSNLVLSYERALTPRTSLETRIKFLGLGFFNDNNRTKGVGLDVGYKMKLRSMFKKDGTFRPDHLLHGSYLKPVLGFHVFEQESGIFTSSNRDYKIVNLGLDLGKQWIINKTVSLDLHFGFHYYGGSVRNSSSGGPVDEANIDAFNAGGLAGIGNVAFSSGFKIGYLFGNYGNDQKGKKRR